jgi:hypothetical protein
MRDRVTVEHGSQGDQRRSFMRVGVVQPGGLNLPLRIGVLAWTYQVYHALTPLVIHRFRKWIIIYSGRRRCMIYSTIAYVLFIFLLTLLYDLVYFLSID